MLDKLKSMWYACLCIYLAKILSGSSIFDAWVNVTSDVGKLGFRKKICCK